MTPPARRRRRKKLLLVQKRKSLSQFQKNGKAWLPYNGSLGAAAGVRATLILDEEQRHECKARFGCHHAACHTPDL
jgi:hypothetical protein